MKKIKRILPIMLAGAMFLNLSMPAFAYSSKSKDALGGAVKVNTFSKKKDGGVAWYDISDKLKKSINSKAYSEVESVGTTNKAINIKVSPNNLSRLAEQYDIPAEVRESVKRIHKKYPKATVTISSSANTNARSSELTTASSSSWGSFRTKKGYKLRDWTVKSQNAFEMSTIKKGKKAGDFIAAMIIYFLGQVCDKIQPYSSVGVTAAQFVFGSDSTYTAKSGDKLQAAPAFTSKEKFTYVYIGDQYFLGTKSYYTKLETISWYLYSSAKHKQKMKKRTYNKVYYSANYKSPDNKALIYYRDGGYIDQPPTLEIGNARFLLY